MTEPAAETWTGVMVTAHRKLPKGADEWLRPALRERLTKLRDEFGMERAITGMAIGGDTVFADVALELGFPLYGAVPFPGQANDQYGPRWTRAQKAHWAELIERCAHVDYVSPTDPLSYGQRVGMLHARNDFMLAQAAAVCAIWAPANRTGGTYSCIVKAVGAGLPVVLFNLATQTVVRPSRQAWANVLEIPALAHERTVTRG